MTRKNLLLTVIAVGNRRISFEVSDGSGRVMVTYDEEHAGFTFNENNNLSEILVHNKVQLQKIIKSALNGKPVPGQQIQCVFIQDFTFINDRDYNHFIRIDRRGSVPLISVSDVETTGIIKLITDGSYAKVTDRSAFAGMIVQKDGGEETFHGSFTGGSSSLTELVAVKEGLSRLNMVDEVQVNTDSRFVIRGLVQWVHFWKLNDWQMAHGRKVKYAEHWQQLDKLGEGKLLELKWIKAHSGDSRHDMCHQLAKKLATG
ncbi:MAG: hypothetical protein JXB00_00210 [Bacteroidales bacterium]|nr:hypothetical protein [Bacteroidales bacterium]